MSLPFIFANVTQAQTAWLDANFAAVGAIGTIPCSVAGTNAITLTPFGNTPDVTGYADYQRFSGTVAVDNTTAVTARIGGLAFLAVFKDTNTGPVALVAGDLQGGNTLELVYDIALSGGAGGFHAVTSPATASGVSGITAGTGLTGGGTGAVNIALAAIASRALLANNTGGSAAPTGVTLTALLDAVIGNTRGMLMYRGASSWQALAPGTAGQQLTTLGTAADPQWGMKSSLGLAATGTTQGTALALTSLVNEVTTVPASTGVVLPGILNEEIFIYNRGANPLNVYPISGAAIDNNAANTAVTVTAGSVGRYMQVSATQFYTS